MRVFQGARAGEASRGKGGRQQGEKAASKPAKKRWFKSSAAGALDVDLASAAPTAGCHEDEDRAPCPSECHKKNEYAADGSVLREDEDYKCYEPCGDDEKPAPAPAPAVPTAPERPLVTAPDDPLQALRPPAASATPVTSAATTGAPVSLTRFADHPLLLLAPEADPDEVIGWLVEAATRTYPTIEAAMRAAAAAQPTRIEAQIEELQEEQDRKLTEATGVLNSRVWDDETVELPTVAGANVDVPMLKARGAVVDMMAAMEKNKPWKPNEALFGPGGASDWLPLERTPDAAGGFYTTEEEMDEDAQKLEALKDQFVYHFPYVRELATADPGIFALDESNWPKAKKALEEQNDPNLDLCEEKKKHYEKYPWANPRVNRAVHLGDCIDAVRAIRGIINKHDYDNQRYQSERQDNKPMFGVEPNDVVKVRPAMKKEYKTSFQRVAQRRDERVGKGESQKAQRTLRA